MKFKTRVYVGNPGKRALIKIDSLKAANDSLLNKIDSLENENKELRIKIRIEG